MSEGKILESGSPVDQFNEIVKSTLEKTSKQPTISVTTASTDELELVQNWFEKPETQNFLERNKSGKQQSLGVVWEVRDVESQTNIAFIDQTGMRAGFVYVPGAPRFADAPNGFKVGDIILTKKSNGFDIESVRPVKFSPKTEKKVLRRFISILNSK